MDLATGRSVLTPPTRIFNNRIVGTLVSGDSAILLRSTAYDVEVSHNTIVVDGRSNSPKLIYVSGTFGRAHKIRHNVLVAAGTASCVTTVSTTKYHYDLDENLYFHRTGGPIARVGSSTYTDLSKWRTALGQDKNSLQADPKFVSLGGFDLHLTRVSSAIGVAKSSPVYVRDDFEGNVRFSVTTSDLGAYEFQSALLFGKGCPGTGGIVPTIRTVGTLSLGTKSFLLFEKGRALARAVLIVGVSDEKWGTIPLPLRFGAGCDLLVSADLLIPLLLPSTGTYIFEVNIPNNSQFLGSQAFFQWAVGDPAAKGIGQAFSTGLKVNIVK